MQYLMYHRIVRCPACSSPVDRTEHTPVLVDLAEDARQFEEGWLFEVARRGMVAELTRDSAGTARTTGWPAAQLLELSEAFVESRQLTNLRALMRQHLPFDRFRRGVVHPQVLVDQGVTMREWVAAQYTPLQLAELGVTWHQMVTMGLEAQHLHRRDLFPHDWLRNTLRVTRAELIRLCAGDLTRLQWSRDEWAAFPTCP